MKWIIHYTAGGVTRYLADHMWGGLWLEELETAMKFDSKKAAKAECERQFRNRPNALVSRWVPVVKEDDLT